MTKINPEVVRKVPREAIENTFGIFLAISPEIFNSVLQSLATRYGVAAEDLEPYVYRVLGEMPPTDPADF